MPTGCDREAPLEVTLLNARQARPVPRGVWSQDICTLARGLVKETSTGAAGAAEGYRSLGHLESPI